jgi:predicted nucleic acid-binding protein
VKALIDTNVLLDVFMSRHPFAASSAAVWDAVENHRIDAVVAAISLTNIHYVLSKFSGQTTAGAAVKLVHQVFPIAAVDGRMIGDAITSGNSDFEDAVQIAAGKYAGVTHIVTRDPKGFRASGLIVLSPVQMMALVGNRPPPQ